MNHLNLNKLLLNSQHGFRKDLSCQTQLFELVTDLHSSLNVSRPVDAIFVDFSKAFDRVPHKRLFLKIRQLQLDQNTTRWIEEFLTNRFQTVKLNNHISNQTRVSSGVPQGSVLGPLLFLIYINDIACSLKSPIRLFADDCVVYREISNPDDTIILQSDLIRLEEWCSRWQMEINVEKTKHIMFSPTPETVPANYKINDTPIDSVQSFKYLGVFFTANLKWTCHIEYISTKALKKLGLLKRRLHLATKETRFHAYNCLIRPSLEYGSIIWHPQGANLTNLLESVQNKATRFITSSYSRYQSVSSLKNSLHLPSLAMRRKLARLSFFHSLYHSSTPFSQLHIIPPPHISARVDHTFKVKPIFAKTERYKNSPLVLAIAEWNALPAHIAELSDSSSFQHALKTFLEVL